MNTKHLPKRVRVGLVGAGSIVRQRHLPGLQALPNVQVVAVCNASLESAQKVAKDFPASPRCSATGPRCSTGATST
ncbi:MAG: Gfo/Idh/MocA family oxidoreductase [Verrucomicrobiota bacterium]